MADDVRSRADWPAGRVLVQTATYDERENIAALVDAVLAVDPELQMLVIDDDSPDGTGQIALEKAAADPRVHVLVRRGRRGLGSAILEGFREGRAHGFEVVVNMDADFSHDPADIPRLLAALEPLGGRPVDVAIGSRRVRGGRTVGWPWSRHVASWLVSWFTRRVLGVPVRDASGGFRAVRLEVLDRLLADCGTSLPPQDAAIEDRRKPRLFDRSSKWKQAREGFFHGQPGPFAQGYAFQEDFLWRVHRAGGRFIEVPITFTDRERGASKADFAEARRSIGELLVLARRTWLGR